MDDVGDELIKGGLECLGGLEEIDEEVEGEVGGALGRRGEAMGRWGEREGTKADGRGGGEGRTEFLDVERGVDEGEGASGVPPVDKLSKG